MDVKVKEFVPTNVGEFIRSDISNNISFEETARRIKTLTGLNDYYICEKYAEIKADIEYLKFTRKDNQNIQEINNEIHININSYVMDQMLKEGNTDDDILYLESNNYLGSQ
jgi:hypothetical protein